MSKQSRKTGKLLRRIAKSERAWRAAGKGEGRAENRLTMFMGRAYRAGVTGAKIAKVRKNA